MKHIEIFEILKYHTYLYILRSEQAGDSANFLVVGVAGDGKTSNGGPGQLHCAGRTSPVPTSAPCDEQIITSRIPLATMADAFDIVNERFWICSHPCLDL